MFGLLLFDIIQAYATAVFHLAPPTTCSADTPQQFSFTLFSTLASLVAAPRSLFAAGSFVHDMYWLLVVCGAAFVTSLISMLRGTPIANAIVQGAIAIRRPGVLVLSVLVAIGFFAEFSNLVREDSPFGMCCMVRLVGGVLCVCVCKYMYVYDVFVCVYVWVGVCVVMPHLLAMC